jgi:hypothetical protein
MTHLGACVYYWGDQEQNRLLLDGVRPWALEARRCGLAERLWYCRFDARGPHVFALFATAAESRAALGAFLSSHIQGFLSNSPSAAVLSPDELQRRHEDCRGKALCAEHREPGFAPNNSFSLFDHDPSGYPLQLSAAMRAADEFWWRTGELTLWTLDQLEGGRGQAAAVRWLAAMHAALQRRRLPAEEYWRMHASTLIPSLAARLEAEGQAALDSVTRAIGERNREAFSRIWNDPGAEGRLGFDVDGIVGPVVADDGRAVRERFDVLREVNHCVLSQLGHKVRLHIPMVLFAWQRSLSR